MMEVIVEFEKSARWPDELVAIQKMKLAFFERMATALMSKSEGTTAQVVLGDGFGRPEIQDQAWLEVVTPEGWAFAVRIWHDREATLLDRIINAQAQMPKVLRKQQEVRLREDPLPAARSRKRATSSAGSRQVIGTSLTAASCTRLSRLSRLSAQACLFAACKTRNASIQGSSQEISSCSLSTWEPCITMKVARSSIFAPRSNVPRHLRASRRQLSRPIFRSVEDLRAPSSPKVKMKVRAIVEL